MRSLDILSNKLLYKILVTIFGESAGGAAVHYLLLSPQAEGLFQKAISQSGSALNPWAYETNPEDRAHKLARDLNITFTDNADLIRQLREVKPSEMTRVVPSMVEYVSFAAFIKNANNNYRLIGFFLFRKSLEESQRHYRLFHLVIQKI